MQKVVTTDNVRLVDAQGNMIAEMNEIQKENDIWLIELVGSIPNDCAYDIADELYAFISVDNGIVLDMNKVEYISSTFANLLVKLQARMEETRFESLPIQNMPNEVFQYLKTQGCAALLDYELKED